MENKIDVMEEKRICSVCGEKMDEGYYTNIDFDEKYYCSDKCLNKIHTKEQWGDIYHKGLGYWTTWW